MKSSKYCLISQIVVTLLVMCSGCSEAIPPSDQLSFEYLHAPTCTIKSIQPDGSLELAVVEQTNLKVDKLKTGRYGGLAELSDPFEASKTPWRVQFFAIEVTSIDDLGNVSAKVGPTAIQKVQAQRGNRVCSIQFCRPEGATDRQMEMLSDYVELQEPELPLTERLGELQKLEKKSLSTLKESASRLGKVARILNEYRNIFRSLPAYKSGPDGKPQHSWRVLALRASSDVSPEAFEVFKKYRMDEPWDSPHNSKLIGEIPDIYRDPAFPDLPPGHTTFVAMTGDKAAFRLKEVDGADGTSKRMEAQSISVSTRASDTLIVGQVDAKRAVPWTQPVDLVVDEKFTAVGTDQGLAAPFTLPGARVGLAAFADGQVRALRNDETKENLTAMLTAIGQDRVTLPFAIDLPYRRQYVQQLYPIVRVSFAEKDPSFVLSCNEPPPYQPKNSNEGAAEDGAVKKVNVKDMAVESTENINPEIVKKSVPTVRPKRAPEIQPKPLANAANGLKFRVIVRHGDAAFSGEKGELSPSFAIINNRSQVAILGTSSNGPPNTNGQGLWIWNDGKLQAVGRQPRITPMGMARDNGLPIAMNDKGELAVVSQESSKADETLIWFGKQENMEPVIQKGQPAPGSDASFIKATFFDSPFILLNSNSALAFSARLRTPPDSKLRNGVYGIWTGTVGELKCAGQTGGASPLKSSEWTHGPLICGLSEDGTLLVRGKAGGKTTSFGGMVWVGKPDGLEVLTANENEANSKKPYLKAGSDSQAAPRMNSKGAYVFGAVASPTATNHCGLWTGTDAQSCKEVVSSSVKLQGSDSKLMRFTQAEINDRGTIAFLAEINERPFPDLGRSNSHALFVLEGRTPRRLIDDARVAAIARDRAPENIKVHNASIQPGFAWNAKNQALLFASIQLEHDRGREFCQALVGVDEDAKTYLVACPHVPIRVGKHQSPDVGEVSMICSSPGSGFASGLNDNGEFVFRATFQESEGKPPMLMMGKFAD